MRHSNKKRDNVAKSRPGSNTASTVRNVEIALIEKIVLLLHPRVDVPYSLVVT